MIQNWNTTLKPSAIAYPQYPFLPFQRKETVNAYLITKDDTDVHHSQGVRRRLIVSASICDVDAYIATIIDIGAVTLRGHQHHVTVRLHTFFVVQEYTALKE